jgi:hypothetical protein
MTEQCRLCGCDLGKSIFEAKSLYTALQYYECSRCAYVQTQSPTWLSAAYADPINPSDTGIMYRNMANVELVISTLAMLGSRKHSVVDYAGGYGILVRMLRDKGINAFWSDPYSTNLLSKGFEYAGGSAGLVTAFEAFEHFVNPLEEALKLSKISSNILISTNIIPDPAPPPGQWWYYGLEHAQHIGFFRVSTLEYIAKQLCLNLMSDGSSIHLFSRKTLSLRKWNLYRKIAKHRLSFLTKGLESKTWSDHMQFSKLSH